eukprot:sb/3475490/
MSGGSSAHSRFWPYGYSHERSREKTEGTRVISVLELVGVALHIAVFGHMAIAMLGKDRFWPFGCSHIRKGVEKKLVVFSVHELVGVGAGINHFWPYGYSHLGMVYRLFIGAILFRKKFQSKSCGKI